MRVDLQLNMKITKHEHQGCLSLYVPRESTNAWCLYLILLEQECVSHLNLKTKTGSLVLEKGRETTMVFGSSSKIVLNSNDIQYICSFFLKYFKNKIADVDHIDIETSAGDYFTIHVDQYSPSLTPQEARKKFNL